MARQSCWTVMSLQMRSLKEKFRLVQVRGPLMYKDGNKKTFTEFNAEIAPRTKSAEDKEKNYNAGKKNGRFGIYDCPTCFLAGSHY
jgi:hypothetical protein